MSEVTREYFLRAFKDVATSEASAQLDGDMVVFPTLGVSVSIGEIDTQPETNVVSVEIFATHDRLPVPVSAVAVGFGDNLQASATTAVQHWFDLFFPVLHSDFADHPTENVSQGTLSAKNERGEKFKWRVHLGPVRIVFAGEPAPEKPAEHVFVSALMHEITGESAQRVPFWLDSFVSRHSDETVHVDCRLVNEHWTEAEDRLREKATTLVPESSGFVSFRQYVFFEPTDFEAPFPGPKKSWLGRLLGIGS